MIRYMLDTNTCIHIIKHRTAAVQAKLSSLLVGEVAISSIVSAELWYGVAYSQKKEQNEEALLDFLPYVEVLNWPNEASRIYGRARAELRRKGTPIGAMDLLIATHAILLDAVLVTDNVKEFIRLRGLKIENWIDR